jgi:hypothetical protein
MVRACLAALLALSAAPAIAQGNFSVGVTGGTLGIGPELGYRFSNSIGLRGNATFLNFSHSFNTNGLRYDGRAKLNSAGAMIDVYPFAGGFRLSAGGRYNGNKARAVATPNSNTSVGGQTFTPAQIGTLRGRADVRNWAPALSLGYGGNLRPGFTFGVEAGALFQGRVRISEFTSSTGLVPQARLDAERADLQDDVDDYHIYPILQVSAGWRF